MEANTQRLKGLVSAWLQLVGGAAYLAGLIVWGFRGAVEAALVVGGLSAIGWGVLLVRPEKQ